MFQTWRDTLPTAGVHLSGDQCQSPTDVNGDINVVETGSKKKINPDFQWSIDGVEELRKTPGGFFSEYFYERDGQYKKRLRVWVERHQLCFWLYVYDADDHTDGQWPFHKDVTIKIVHHAHPQTERSITRRCKIDKPSNNSYGCSEKFVFEFDELSDAGLLYRGDELTVRFCTS